MKNRIICLVILILSLVAFAASFNSTQAYYHNSRGNSFFKEKKFDEARDEYNKSLKIKESNEVRNNIIKSLYEEKNIKRLLKLQVQNILSEETHMLSLEMKRYSKILKKL